MTSAAPVPVIPLHEATAGLWEALIAPVSTAADVEVRELAGLVRQDALVRIGDEVRRLPVYRDKDGAAWVTWDDAFSVSDTPAGAR